MKNIKSFSHTLATFFYIGYLQPASGTWASLAALILWIIIPLKSFTFHILLVLVTFSIGIVVSTKVEQTATNNDPSFIVIDEVAGIWTALLFISGIYWKKNLLFLALTFILFRFFDILKLLPPIKKAESLKGGFGIMLDDIIAGIYAGLLTRIVMWIFK